MSESMAEIPFIAVGRVQDCLTLAFFAADDAQTAQTKDIFRKLLAAAASKLMAGQRTRLQWNDGSVCCAMDAEAKYFYCVVTSSLAYPENLAYQLLHDLGVAVKKLGDIDAVPENGLAAIIPKMKDLVTHYEDARNFPDLVSARSFATSGTAGPGNSFPAGPPSRSSNTWVFIGLAILLVVIVIVVLVNMSGGSQVSVTEELAVTEVATRTAWTNFRRGGVQQAPTT